MKAILRIISPDVIRAIRTDYIYNGVCKVLYLPLVKTVKTFSRTIGSVGCELDRHYPRCTQPLEESRSISSSDLHCPANIVQPIFFWLYLNRELPFANLNNRHRRIEGVIQSSKLACLIHRSYKKDPVILEFPHPRPFELRFFRIDVDGAVRGYKSEIIFSTDDLAVIV